MLSIPGERFGISPEDLGKEVDDPSRIMDLTESPPKEVVGNPPRSLTNVQVDKKITVYEIIRTASEILEANARRYQAIANNTGIFFSVFELDFNRCIRKAKKFFPNIDPNFLTLTDLNLNL